MHEYKRFLYWCRNKICINAITVTNKRFQKADNNTQFPLNVSFIVEGLVEIVNC
jgi:hypothetical protein